MYKTLLVKSLVDEGEQLIRRLESRRLQVTAGLWYYFDDRWRLVIASPTVEREGPLRMYTRIAEAIGELHLTELTLSDTTVMRPNGYEFRELRLAVERTGNIAGLHPRSRPRDIGIEDAYIYRWPPPWPKLSRV